MTASLTAHRGHLSPRFPTRLLEHYLGLTLLLWALFTAGALVLVLTVAAVRDIEVSGWDRVIQAVRWFGFFVGLQLGWTALPLHISHGQTRHQFMAQVSAFIPVFAAVLAAMVAVTFVAEIGLYELAGWPQDVQEKQIYGSAGELHLIFLQHWLITALWAVGGLFIGAAWYRNDWYGALAMVTAIAAAGIAGITFNSDLGPTRWAYEQLTGDEVVSAPAGVAIHVVLIALMLGLTWLVVRGVPLRSRKA